MRQAASSSSLSSLRRYQQALAHRWSRMAVRERRAVTLAAAVVLLALVWLVLLAPALATLRQAPAQQTRLNQQLALMRSLQTQAQQLQQQPTIHTADALRLLQDSSQPLLESGQINVQGHVVSVSFKNVPAQQLAHWLSHTRSSASATPAQAQLTHSATGWSGSVTFHLPQGEQQP